MEFSLKLDLDDIERLVSLINSAYRGTDGAGRWTSENHLVDGDRILPEDLETLIRDTDTDFMVGTIKGIPVSCISIKRYPEYIEFGTFAVDPAFHGRGYGARLLQYAEEVNSRCASIFQVTVVSMNRDLINFYTRRGYKNTGNRLPYPVEMRVGMPKVAGIDLTVLRKQL